MMSLKGTLIQGEKVNKICGLKKIKRKLLPLKILVAWRGAGIRMIMK